jgi:hypothetical protein
MGADQVGVVFRNLQWHWGGAYQITGSAEHWLARRRDNGRLVTAQSLTVRCARGKPMVIG